MSFERSVVKKIYYYSICAVTLFVLMWGSVDIVSSILGITLFKPPSVSLEMPQGGPQGGMGGDSKNMAEPLFDEYYQSRMVFDRMGDSIARILIAGCIFFYASSKIREIEVKEI
jgi:hypothetical protein